MLNKKAIAAFAAGATLLSGFAFAAPAMANVNVPDCPVNREEWNLKSENESIAALAKKAWDDAKADVPAVPQEPQEPSKAEVKALYVADGNDGKLKMVTPLPNDTKPEDAAAAQAYVNQKNLYVANKANYDAKLAAANDAHAQYLKALDNVNNCSNPDPTEDQVKRALINKVRLAKMNLDNKDDELAVAKNKFNDAYKALVAAIAEYNARMDAFSAANGKLNAFLASGVNDSATLTRLRDAADRAEAHLKRATLALAKAKAAYDDALAKDLAAVAAYNKALQTYKDVYNEAVAAGVNPALLPPVVTSDPLDPKVPAVPGLKHAYASAMSGKFGKEAKAAEAAAKQGKDTKASAQQNNNANGAAAGANGAAAAGLAKTGAAVAMAAVAASVLAGMGAALRKIRH
ncbi:hypothetical protein [Gardnerella sp. DNF00497B]|uniref:hypothetical protein n=1 Tax=Gardnerella sp. DNF00497B TaxID=2749048 RepID=UPI003BB1531E